MNLLNTDDSDKTKLNNNKYNNNSCACISYNKYMMVLKSLDYVHIMNTMIIHDIVNFSSTTH